jgi:hypothetical protein
MERAKAMERAKRREWLSRKGWDTSFEWLSDAYPLDTPMPCEKNVKKPLFRHAARGARKPWDWKEVSSIEGEGRGERRRGVPPPSPMTPPPLRALKRTRTFGDLKQKNAIPLSFQFATQLEDAIDAFEVPASADLGVLLQELCVIDVDDVALADGLEARFPELKTAAAVQTRKGRHYYFTRSALADAHGYYDGAAQVFLFVFLFVCWFASSACCTTTPKKHSLLLSSVRSHPPPPNPNNTTKQPKQRSRPASTSRRAR